MIKCNDQWNFKNQAEYKKAIMGIIMSDGYLGKDPRRGKNHRLTIVQKNQGITEFFERIVSWLTGYNICEVEQKGYGNGNIFRLTTNVHPIYTKLYEKFYQGKPRRKTFHPFLRNISDLGIYLMYLGDGSQGKGYMRLHTENFNLTENRAIQKMFKDKWNIQFKIRKSKKKYFYLEVTGQERNKFYQLLLPFKDLVKSACYKFPSTEEIKVSKNWRDILRTVPRNPKNGQFIPYSRDGLNLQAIEGK